jgi:predicted acylesterase/phospholipase RssA
MRRLHNPLHFRLPESKFMAISQKPFRILTLDGGGTFALIEAKALDDLYPGQSGHEVLSHFDMVVGCSGGSVVASLLIEGLSPREIFEMFDDIENRKQLFGALPWHKALLSRITGALGNSVGPRFSTAGKLQFLRNGLPTTGDVPLHEVQQELRTQLESHRRNRNDPSDRDFQIMIVTHDFDRGRVRMMRSNWQSAAANFPRHKNSSISLAEAVHASSTAPVNWFDKPAQFDHGRYWDGAMTGYNNPVLAAVAEAVAQGVPRENIGVLSIGTSAISLPPAGTPGVDVRMLAPAAKASFMPSVIKVSKLIISDPPDIHPFLAHLMLGGSIPADPQHCPELNTPVVRMNPLVQPVFGSLAEEGPAQMRVPAGWTVEEFARLIQLDIATIENADVELIKRMCDGWMRDEWHNQPIRHGGNYPPASLRDLDRCWEIGHRVYGQAKRAWLGAT